MEEIKMSGGVVVTKGSPAVVRPSEMETSTPAASDTVPLSSFDRCMPPFPVTMLLVFDRAIDAPVETIKEALSRALAHYPPVAGRIVSDGSGIACTGEGVTFVAASASCSLKEAEGLPQMDDDLAVSYPGLLCRSTDPLLMVQATEFSCGRFTVGVTWNHLLADAAGMVQFLQAVGELARCGISPPSVVPVRRWDDDSLPSLPSSIVAAQKATLLDFEPQHVARLDVIIPSTLVSRIKAGRLGGGDQPCTTFDAVAAVLWRCRTRAVLSDTGGESPAPLTFPCNVRAHVRAPAGYYGNCVAMQVVPATVGVVANSDVGGLVRMIRSAKAKVAGLLSGDGGGVGGQTAAAAPLWYETLAVSSWRNMGLDATDFGGGAPARVLWRTERPTVPSCVVCPPRRAGSDGGVDVSSMFLKPEHVDAFLGELARLVAASEI
ncbi:unnamed protein product [Urochloa humidicola]